MIMPTLDLADTSLPYWGDAPEVWEKVSLAGVEIPGVCRVSGTGMRLRSETRKSPGRDGASVAIMGLDIAAFSIEVTMWKPEHLSAFRTIIGMAKPTSAASNGRSQAVAGIDLTPLDVSHPALHAFGITQCIVDSVSIPTERSPGIWTSTISCREFDPRMLDRGQPKTSRSGKSRAIALDSGVTTAIQTPSSTNSGPST